MPSETKFVQVGSSVDFESGAAWVNPENISVQDGVGAVATQTLNEQDWSDTLRGLMTGSPFAVPTDRTITGISVRVRGKTSLTNSTVLGYVRLIKAGTAVGSNLGTLGFAGNLSTSYSDKNHGGSTNLWGTSWTPADVNHASFGAEIRVWFQLDTAAPFTADIDCIEITVHYSDAPPSPAPTISGVSPNNGTRLGGTSVTITGTNFTGASAVRFGTLNAASFVVNNSTQITAVTPAHASGLVTVSVVRSGHTATLNNAFTFNPILHTKSLSGSLGALTGVLTVGRVADNIVRLVKGGTVVGDNKAKSAAWPAVLGFEEYGGASDLWGTTWTPAQINADDFGFVLSANVDRGIAHVDYADITVFYSITNVSDPTSMLQTLKIGSNRLEATPQMWKVGRSGLTVSNDPNVPKHRDNAQLFTSRLYKPSKIIKKLYERFEFWVELEPEANNTPGFEVWASIDDGAFFQLLNSNAAAATIRTSGPHTLYFPATSASVGHYCQLEYRVPTKIANQQDVAVTLRDRILWASMWSKTSKMIETTLVLAHGQFEDGTLESRPVEKQKLDLEALAAPLAAPMEYSDTHGNTGYAKVIRIVSLTEAIFQNFNSPVYLANVILRVNPYED